MQWLLISVATISSLSLVLAADSPAAGAPEAVRDTRSFGSSNHHLGQADLGELENWRALYAKRAAMLKRGFDGYNGLGGGDFTNGQLQDWSGLFERGLRAFGKQGPGLGADGGLSDDGLQNWMAFYQRRSRDLRKRSV